MHKAARTAENDKTRSSFLKLSLIAAVSLAWLIVRTGSKPSRITYPCQKAAITNVHIFLLALLAPLVNFRNVIARSGQVPSFRKAKIVFILGSLLIAFGSITYSSNHLLTNSSQSAVPLNLSPQSATTSSDSSDLFFVTNALDAEGNTDAAVTNLFQMMDSKGLFLFNTASQPSGLIARDDVVIIKVNCQWPSRGGTNTDLTRSLIKKLVAHPEVFVGEIVIADNGQGLGNLDWTDNNAYDHSQSMKDVADSFSSHKVSVWLWDTIEMTRVDEYDVGDYSDGYVVNSTRNSATYLQVSYPKFKTKFGTYISFKKGIWNTTTESYNSEKLKVINVPVLKTHGSYGVTACVKHYMGVVSQGLTGAHSLIRYGAMGTEMAETTFPTLNMLDAIWVNANPTESSTEHGPMTSYEAASFTDVVGASQDPVALEYWASKHILIPAAVHKGYTAYSSLNPDYAPVTPGLTESYHNYLESTWNQLRDAGYNVRMNETEMNVFVRSRMAKVNIDVTPKILNLKSEAESVTVFVEPWEGHNASQIDLSSIRLNNTLSIDLDAGTIIGDYDSDGVSDLTVKFGRTAVSAFILSQGITTGNTTLTVTGRFEYGTLFEGSVIIKARMPGDVNVDGKVDIRDVAFAANAFGSYPEHPRWCRVADENEDGRIDIKDIALIARNFGKTWAI